MRFSPHDCAKLRNFKSQIVLCAEAKLRNFKSQYLLCAEAELRDLKSKFLYGSGTTKLQVVQNLLCGSGIALLQSFKSHTILYAEAELRNFKSQLLVVFCSSVPVVLFDTPGISGCRSQHVPVESSSLLHHSIYLWFICFPWWSIDELENLHADRTFLCFEPWKKGEVEIP